MAVIEFKKVKINFQRIKHMNKPAKKKLFLGGLALLAVIIIILAVYFWQFRSFSIEVSDPNENTLVYSYYPADGKILKCASDSAVLTNNKNAALWETEYDMSDPEVDVCGSTILIFDKGGTNVVICGNEGKLSEFRTELPIVKAEVSSAGAVAVLQDDGSTAEINYYDKDGDVIAAVKTTMANNGYPMDIALSDDGMTIAVSYITFDQGTTVSHVVFYGFDSEGQAASDNIIGDYSYENEIIPELEYTQKNKFTAFGTNTISVYRAGGNVEEISRIEVEDKIKSTFSNDRYFGYVMLGNDNSGYEIVIFNSNGKEKKRITTEFAYTSIQIQDDLIIMNNRNEMAVYTVSGVLKFDGGLNSLVREIRLFGGNRYAMAATDGYYVIRLY